MKRGLKNIKGIKVYNQGDNEAWGIIADVYLAEKTGKIEAFVVKTISVIPIRKAVLFCNAWFDDENRLIVNDKAGIENLEHFEKNKAATGARAELFKLAALTNGITKKIRDLNFDTETGDICDVVVLKNLIAGDSTISVNKLSVKDNTIYTNDL